MQRKNNTVVVVANVYTDTIRHAVDRVYRNYGLEPVCTSGQDSLDKHKTTGMHPKGRALDIRFWDLLDVVANQIRAQLPHWYEVLVEKDHFHIEADSKHEPKDV